MLSKFGLGYYRRKKRLVMSGMKIYKYFIDFWGDSELY